MSTAPGQSQRMDAARDATTPVAEELSPTQASDVPLAPAVGLPHLGEARLPVPAPPPSTPPSRESMHLELPPQAPPSPRLSDSRPHTPHQPHHRSNRPARRLLARIASLAKKPKSSPAIARRSSVQARSPYMGSPDLSSAPQAADLPPVGGTSTRRHLKIRLVTHNMAESLSTGDLSEMLGDLKGVSEFRSRQYSTSTTAASTRAGTSTAGSVIDVSTSEDLPTFRLDAMHPYHIIVVAGQEVPTASGVLNGRVRTLNGRGWTSILEDYLCGTEVVSEEAITDAEDTTHSFVNSHKLGEHRDSNKSSVRASQSHTEEDGGTEASFAGVRRGPYILVEKARLMGIYLAVFVARSCDMLVDGVSIGRVTAGLIGGRVGNKGAVGISLKFAGSRLLFISAHLAAHSHAIEMRKDNVRKIFAELDVDDFLPEGPKPKLLTDRFDQCFFIGDLNFRLDISRLQADWWIVKSKDYATALEFDQLRGVMQEPDSVFKGFSEGAIHFAPTYKYDIPSKVKKRRNTMLRASKTVKRAAREWTAFEPADVDTGAATDPETLQATQDREDDDALSVVSDRESVTSGLSECERIDASSLALPSQPPKGNSTSMDAVRKAAHVRFRTLVRTNSAAAAFVKAARKANEADRASAAAIFAAAAGESPSSTAPNSGRTSPFNIDHLGLPPVPVVRPVLRSAHSDMVIPMQRHNDGAETPTTDDGGSTTPLTPLESPSTLQKAGDAIEACFDSSSKQRVQSYTDRILFKSTVPIPEDPPRAPLQPRRTSGFVDSLRGLVHGFHGPSPESVTPEPSYFDRPLLEHADTDDTAVRRARFVPGTTTEAQERSRPSPGGLQRAKSLQTTRLQRRSSLAYSVKSNKSHDETGRSFWRRVSSGTKLNKLDTPRPTGVRRATTSSMPNRGSSGHVSPATPMDGDLGHSNVTSNGLRSQKRRPVFGNRSAASSPAVSRANSLTKVRTAPLPAVASPPSPSNDEQGALDTHLLSRTLTRALPRSASGTHGNSLNRFKSFFHLSSLPFLAPRVDDAVDSSPPPSPAPAVGPRQGEIQVVAYDAVADLARMGAASDHRPVFAVLAVGVGGDPVVV